MDQISPRSYRTSRTFGSASTYDVDEKLDGLHHRNSICSHGMALSLPEHEQPTFWWKKSDVFAPWLTVILVPLLAAILVFSLAVLVLQALEMGLLMDQYGSGAERKW